MDSNDSCIIIGTRKSIITSESESESGGLRHRYSSGSSSIGSSSGSPNTPPCSTSTPHSKVNLPQRFGIHGSINMGYYGSFQPNSYTDGYVPPLSLNTDREKFCGYQNELQYQNKSDEVIKIDSGYGRSTNNDSYFMSRRNLSFNSSSSPSMWDSLVASPIQTIRQKIRGRPSYVDEGSTSNSRFKINPQQILAGLIFALVVVSIVMILIISYKHFNIKNESGKEIKIQLKHEVNLEQSGAEVKSNSKERMAESLLLKDEITIEEVEKMREELKAKFVSQGFREPEVSRDDVEEKSLLNLAVSLDEVHSLEDSAEVFSSDIKNEFNEDKVTAVMDKIEMKGKDVHKEEDVTNQEMDVFALKEIEVKSKKKSKNANPMMKSIHVNKKSKAKIPLINADPVKVDETDEVSLDYPDDPTFRGGQDVKRTKRDDEDTEEQGIGEKFRKYKNDNGGKFRKYKDDSDHGFRKKGNVLGDRE